MERSRDWLKQAERDLEQARWALKGGFYEWTCFSAQQAAEKAVKALIEALRREAWGHSITRLLASLPQGFEVERELMEKAMGLDKFYIQTRYPNGFPVGAPMDYYTEEEAKRAVGYAEEIISFCRRHLARISGAD
ncbi:MAG TPA: HEPN domain-containing protein [Chloroflexi bacterium]|nr:HEPN domain-containing protein [Chloroflexota bacterium]